MEQDNNIISNDTNFINKNSSETTKSYIILTILAGILTLAPVSALILGLIDRNANISENVYIISFYIVKIIGFLIYFFALKEITKSKKIISLIAGISLLISGLMYIQMYSLENTGIDSIGQELAMAMLFNLCIYIYYILAFILFIMYAKKFLFKKKAIITIIITIIISVALIMISSTIEHYTTVQEVNDYIPSVSDFKNVLIEKNLYTSDYLLFGVDNTENNIHNIHFDSDSNKKYPSYIYYGYKTRDLSKNIGEYGDYISWIIYYTNGKIYAALGYDDIQSFQDFYTIELSSDDDNILSEDDEIYTYNWEKNNYEKININKNGVINEELCYYYEDGTYIEMDVLKKDSFSLFDYKIVDKIDSNTLDNYVENLK